MKAQLYNNLTLDTEKKMAIISHPIFLLIFSQHFDFKEELVVESRGFSLVDKPLYLAFSSLLLAR